MRWFLVPKTTNTLKVKHRKLISLFEKEQNSTWDQWLSLHPYAFSHVTELKRHQYTWWTCKATALYAPVGKHRRETSIHVNGQLENTQHGSTMMYCITFAHCGNYQSSSIHGNNPDVFSGMCDEYLFLTCQKWTSVIIWHALVQWSVSRNSSVPRDVPSNVPSNVTFNCFATTSK